MPRQVENVIGKRFGKLLVLENLQIKKHSSTLHKCLCDCGNITEVPLSYLKSGHTKSCGCLRIGKHKTHNLCDTRLYSIYYGILKRCYNKNHSFYYNYGGRGISVCKDWLYNFENFYYWAIKNGYQENLMIDRIDNDKGYCPENCRWVDRKTQNSNTRRNKFFTFNGQTKTISDWAMEMGIPKTTLFRRIKENRPLDEIFFCDNLKRKKEL